MNPNVIQQQAFADDRGIVYTALTNLDQFGIKRSYVVKNWSKGMIRAWHGHKKASTFMHVIKGAAKLAAVSIDGVGEPFVTVLTENTPGVLWVPPGYYNGAMSLEDDTRILVYSTLLIEEVKNDDFRAHWSTNGGTQIWKVEPR